MSKDTDRRDKPMNRTSSLKEKFRSRNGKNLSTFRPSLKDKLTDDTKSLSVDEELSLIPNSNKIDAPSLLMQAYKNLLFAIFDPAATVSEEHFFQMKSLVRFFSHEKDGNLIQKHDSINNESFKQTFIKKTSKHESINETAETHEAFSLSRKRDSKSSSSKNSLSIESKTNENANLLTKLNELFKFIVTESVSRDIDDIRQQYANGSCNAKKIKSILKIFVKKASNLIAQDSCGTSDPYVTIQCGNSTKVKKTKTIKKTLDPVWDELIQFDFISTANSLTGDQTNGKDELLIRVIDEDFGLKGQLDKILTTEDFLGQITLKLNDLNVFGEHSYQLKPRNSKEKVTGTITLAITLNSFEIDHNLNPVPEEQTTNFIEQYRMLHMFIFEHVYKRKHANDVFTSADDITWIFDSIDLINFKCSTVVYFRDLHLNLLLSYFANKYFINEIHRQMFHMECFYTYFIDWYFLDNSKLVLNRDFVSNAKIFSYMNYILNKISSGYMNKTRKDNDHIKFLHETCSLPTKMITLLMNYRQFYPVKRNEEVEQPSIKELKEAVGLFRCSCNLIQKNLISRSFLSNLKNFDSNENLIQISGYCEKKQFETVTQCIEISLNKEINNILDENEGSVTCNDVKLSTNSDNSSKKCEISSLCSADYNCDMLQFDTIKLIQDKIDTFFFIFTNKKLLTEIDLNDKYYYLAFNDYFFNHKQFKSVCVRLILKEFLSQLIELIKVSKETLTHLKSDDVKQILNLYLLVNRFIADNNLNKISLNDLLSYSFLKSQSNLSINSTNLNELFQPFLFDFIKEQESKFISYIDKLYDMNKINSLAEEIEKSINYNKLSSYSINSESNSSCSINPKYYSTSVTDLFTILHELLDIILQFDTNIDTNLIKNKLLIYIAHVKNEYYKLYHKNNQLIDRSEQLFGSFRTKKFSISISETNLPSDDLTIKSCILINNFQKSIELLDDIEYKLNNKSINKSTNIDSTLKSIVEVLEENINYMIKEYCKRFINPFSKSCDFLKSQLFENNNSAIPIMVKFIDDVCYRIFNNKLKICKIILFDTVFKKFLIEMFKTTLSCIEETIIMRASSQCDPNPNENRLIEKFEKLFNFNYGQINAPEHEVISETQYSTIKIIILRIIDFFSADEEVLKKSVFTELNEYKKVLKTLDLNHMSSSDLMSLFVQTQKHQNSIDFSKSFGKVRLIVEIKQNLKIFNEFTFNLRMFEGVDLKTSINYNAYKSSFFYPFADVHVLGPNPNDQMKSIKIIEFDNETNRVNFDSRDVFTFKLKLFREKVLNDKNYLDDYEIQIVVKEAAKLTERAKVIGVATLNLNEVLNAAIVWKKLIEKENDLMFNFNDYTVCGALDLWLNLRPKLKFDEEGFHILKVLDKHKGKQAVNFVNLKSTIRDL